MAEKYSPESEKVDGTMRKILSVSHEELQRRESERKRRKKRAKTSPASRASSTET
jgi:hypothetical protein